MTRYTSPTKKARICRDKAAGVSDTDIAKKFGLHRTTVKRIFNQYTKSEHYYDIKQKTGRPCLFTKHDTRHAVHTIAMGQARDITDLQRKHFPHINPETI
ncbi:hypothetical protein BDN67DRAFT_911902 [Paxillus ammoniavirescens]|nr:hypothetical protein BDN67DRAFT_911902 [Paxillus ammoniavirescens]